MATFVCVHGAGGSGSHWSLVAAELRSQGHETVAMDLPCEQEVGLAAYTDRVVEAIGERREDVVLVAHSLAGFVAPLVCSRIPVELMVFVAAMVPRPGEAGMQWWANTGHGRALAAQGLADDSPETLYTHDVEPAVLAALGPPRHQTATLFEEPWPLTAWPEVTTRFIVCREDRLFPREWLADLARQRLGVEALVVPGGHCAMLSQPRALSEALVSCWNEHLGPTDP